jgi:hypothetical protein
MLCSDVEYWVWLPEARNAVSKDTFTGCSVSKIKPRPEWRQAQKAGHSLTDRHPPSRHASFGEPVLTRYGLDNPAVLCQRSVPS